MKNTILITLALLLSSCCNYDYKISNLKNEKIKFDDLPQAVKYFLIQPPDFDNKNPSSLLLINSEESERYVLEIEKTWGVASWVDYMRLVDNAKKISYKINPTVPCPFFVYDNKLYIPNRYNIVVVNKNIEEVEFTCYILKDK